MRAPHEELRADLSHQHRHLRAIMLSAKSARGDVRQEAFDQFRQFLAAHEAVEQQFIHGPTRGTFDENRGLVESRLHEEDRVAELIRSLEDLDSESREFDALFSDLSSLVDAHFEAEEHQELPVFVQVAGEDDVGAAFTALGEVAKLAEVGIGDARYEDWVDRMRERLDALQQT